MDRKKLRLLRVVAISAWGAEKNPHIGAEIRAAHRAVNKETSDAT